MLPNHHQQNRYDHDHHISIPKGSAPHTGIDQIPETGADYSEDTTNPKTISGATEAPRSTKAVEPIVHEGEQGLSISFSHEQ